MKPPTPPIRSTESLGRLIRTAREDRALTQAQLAEQALTTRLSILRLEAGVGTQWTRILFDTLAALDLELTIRERHRG